MLRILTGPEADRHVTNWVAARIPEVTRLPENSTAIGIASGTELLAGVVYSNWTGSSLEASIASAGPGWATRGTLRFIFAYPFRQLGAKTLVAVTTRGNRKARDFNRRLGFQERGVIHDLYPGADGVIYEMRKTNCKWI